MFFACVGQRGGWAGAMARMARMVMPDVAHHVTQRGNRREDVFFEDAARRFDLPFLHS